LYSLQGAKANKMSGGEKQREAGQPVRPDPRGGTRRPGRRIGGIHSPRRPRDSDAVIIYS